MRPLARLCALALAASALTACDRSAEDREAYTAGLRAPDLDAGLAACARVSDLDRRGDCASAVIERFAAFERCGEVPEGRWRDECLFLGAEKTARTGDIRSALESCRASAFAEQCDDHVLGIWVMGLVDADPETVADGLAAFAPLLTAPRVDNQVWRSYFRNRIARDLPVDSGDCRDRTCRAAAQLEAAAAVRELQRRVGDATFCAGPVEYPAWAVAARTRRWVDEQRERGCAGGDGIMGPGGMPGPPPIQPGGGVMRPEPGPPR